MRLSQKAEVSVKEKLKEMLTIEHITDDEIFTLLENGVVILFLSKVGVESKPFIHFHVCVVDPQNVSSVASWDIPSINMYFRVARRPGEKPWGIDFYTGRMLPDGKRPESMTLVEPKEGVLLVWPWLKTDDP